MVPSVVARYSNATPVSKEISEEIQQQAKRMTMSKQGKRAGPKTRAGIASKKRGKRAELCPMA